MLRVCRYSVCVHGCDNGVLKVCVYVFVLQGSGIALIAKRRSAKSSVVGVEGGFAFDKFLLCVVVCWLTGI